MDNIGTAWWLQKKDYDRVFKYNIIDRNQDYNKICLKSAGIITNFERTNNIEKIHYIDDNFHVLLIGSSRSILIPSITMLRTSSERIYLLVMLKANCIYILPQN